MGRVVYALSSDIGLSKKHFNTVYPQARFARPFNSVRSKIAQGIAPTDKNNTDENKINYFLPKFGAVLG